MRRVDTSLSFAAPHPDLILKVVAQVTGSTVDILTGPRREPRVVASRDVAAYMLRFVGLLSWRETADALNRVKAETAFEAVTRVLNRIDKDPNVSDAVEMIAGKITAAHETIQEAA